MIRGFMKTSSRTALVAAAGMLMSTYACAPAKAADLGGGCCADLEERVAELEATAAKKGNRVVSLQVYGQVNKALLIWDDGIDSRSFIVDNDYSSSRLGFNGTAKVVPGWTAGYLIEFDYQDAGSDKVNNGLNTTGFGAKNGDDVNSWVNPAVNNGEFYIRHNNWYIESERLGRITVGQGSTAADGAHEIVLANSLRYADANHGNSFALRFKDAAGVRRYTGGVLNDVPAAGGSWASDLDGNRDQVIRYDSPSVYGFILSASWGDRDYTDVVLRFKREMNSIRVAGAIDYQWDQTQDARLFSINPETGVQTLYDQTNPYNAKFQTFGGSISVMHVPTGLYMAFAAAQRDYHDTSVAMPDSSFWYLQGGIEKKWMPLGATTLYGEFGEYGNFRFDGSKATRWGLGAVQKIDKAAMDIYAQATIWSFNAEHEIISGVDYGWIKPEDLTTIMLGSRIQF
jgi:hypothetical protein